jgi:tetratricopeptide (TPR) repeat protein
MTAAVDQNKPYELVLSGHHSSYLHILMNDYEKAEAVASKVSELSKMHQIPYFAATSTCMLGHARAQLGYALEGMELIRDGLARIQAIGPIGVSYFTAYLAEAQMRADRIRDARRTIEAALNVNVDELACRPEILRLRGEINLKQGRVEEAEVDFHESIALAQTMSAKAWELRAVMSLGRLLKSQGRHGEARAMLAEIYGWFTEGFDTADLRDARALLDELSE